MANVLLFSALLPWLSEWHRAVEGKKETKNQRPHEQQQEHSLFFLSYVLCNLYTQINDVRLMRDRALKHQTIETNWNLNSFVSSYFYKCVCMFIVCIRLSDDGRVFITRCMWRLLAIGGYQRQLTTRSIESISFVSDESISTQTKTLNRPKYIDPPSASRCIHFLGNHFEITKK